MFDYLKKGDKRGQVTIFIILAVLVVAGIVLVIMLTGDSDDSQDVSGDQEVQSPSAFLESCSEREIFGLMRELRFQGGSLSPQSNASAEQVPFLDRDVAYLCYSNSVGEECVVQQSSLVNHMESQLYENSLDIFDSCFSQLKDSYGDQGYEVSGGDFRGEEDLELDLRPGKLVIEVNSTELNLEMTNESRSINPNFEFVYSSSLYGLGNAANFLINEESSKRDFDVEKFTLLYPSYDVERNKTVDFTEIYFLRHVPSSKEFRFAVRERN